MDQQKSIDGIAIEKYMQFSVEELEAKKAEFEEDLEYVTNELKTASGEEKTDLYRDQSHDIRHIYYIDRALQEKSKIKKM